MSGELEPAASNEAALQGDRGIRVVDNMPMSAYIAFGAQVQAYQVEHPDTIVRVTQTFSLRRGVGTITVRWWQRGTEQP